MAYSRGRKNKHVIRRYLAEHEPLRAIIIFQIGRLAKAGLTQGQIAIETDVPAHIISTYINNSYAEFCNARDSGKHLRYIADDQILRLAEYLRITVKLDINILLREYETIGESLGAAAVKRLVPRNPKFNPDEDC